LAFNKKVGPLNSAAITVQFVFSNLLHPVESLRRVPHLKDDKSDCMRAFMMRNIHLGDTHVDSLPNAQGLYF
ncbi:MAG: hypothetical protein ACPHF3_15535, partial [Pseudomonadales bacterium]